MATGRIALILSLLLAPLYVLSLQVSPNSPCASVCVDKENLDLSDPNSSNTRNEDIVCKDTEYARTTVGVKWQNCMTCLQKSTFSQGSESDQGWFLYNLRYNFNHCIFGYPNNTKIGSNPCQTSTACGALKKALQEGSLEKPSGEAEYGYCNADGAAMTGQFYSKCLSCVGVFTDQVVVTNGLVALEAGCQQRPAPGKVLGLSDSIFSTTKQITILETASENPGGATGGSSTPTTMIAIIVIASLIAVAAIASIVVVCTKKRRNQSRRAAASGGDASSPQDGGGIGLFRGYRRSSLSFQCQTHLSPTSPKFFPGGDESSSFEDAMQHQEQQQQYEKRHIVSRSPNTTSAPSLWRPNNAISSLAPVSEYSHQSFSNSQPAPSPSLSEKHQLLQLQQLTTSLPAAPRNVYSGGSPSTATSTRMSPLSAATPTSTTQLLPTTSRIGGGGNGGGISPYVPADWSPVSSRQQQTSSPSLSPQQQWGWGVNNSSNTTNAGVAGVAITARSSRISIGAGGKKAFRESGSPTETRSIQTSFPAPPKR